MKAIVKETGEIVEIASGVICIDKNGYKQTIHSDFIEPYIDTNTDNDYWEKLKHQYAGMAMQGIMSNKEMFNTIINGVYPPERPAYISARCDEYATALVNRLKEEEK